MRDTTECRHDLECSDSFAELEARLKPMNTSSDVAELCGVSESTLAHWRTMGVGPRFVKIGRRVHYPKEELLNCFRSHLYSRADQVRP